MVCVGFDGHVGIEFIHGAGGCNDRGETRDSHHDADVALVFTAEECTDFALTGNLAVFNTIRTPILTRRPVVRAHFPNDRF